LEGTLGAARPNDGRRPPTAVGRPPTRAECHCVPGPRVSRRAAPTLSSKSALAPRFRGAPRPCQRLEIGRYHSPPHPTYLGGESPRYGGRGGPSLRPRVQGGVVRWTLKVPPWTRYLDKVPWQGGTVDLPLKVFFYRGRAENRIFLTAGDEQTTKMNLKFKMALK